MKALMEELVNVQKLDIGTLYIDQNAGNKNVNYYLIHLFDCLFYLHFIIDDIYIYLCFNYFFTFQ